MFSVHKRYLVGIVPYDNHDIIMHVTDFRKTWFGLGQEIKCYTSVKGSCIVWYTYPEFRRCSTDEELLYSQMWEKYNSTKQRLFDY